MGLGLLGRGVGDALFFAKAGAELTVTDLKNAEQLASSARKLAKYKNVRLVLGEHRLEDFRPSAADMVVKAAGVPLDSPFIVEALATGVPVLMSTSLFAKLTPAQVVGITGTRGKSTVTDMIFQVLSRAARSGAKDNKSGRRIFLGGNVLGVSTLDLLPKTSPKDIAVLELDSWQLQGFAGAHETKINFTALEEKGGSSPHIAVFTTFMPDHMNYYKGDMARYFADKAHIYRFQNPSDVLVVSEQVARCIKKYGPKPRARVVVARPKDLPKSWHLKIPGEHNRLNAALAVAALRAMNVPEKVIRAGIEAYTGMPGRLEFVKKYKGVDIYNDTNSTTPDATLAALAAFKNKSILIFGGADKKLDMSALLRVLPRSVKALVVLPGTGTDLIRPALEKMAPVVFVSTMKEAVAQALAHAKAGDRILMSPGFASFGLFKNEYDRGDQFNACLKKLR